MNQQLVNYAEEIIDIFRTLHKSFKTHNTCEVLNSGFTVPQILLMSELSEAPGITLNELSKRLKLSKSTVSGIIDRLEKGGYVIREIPEENRRIVKVYLSEEALKHQKWIKSIKTQHIIQVLNFMGLEDAEKTIEAFRKLDYAVKAVSEEIKNDDK